MDIEKELAEIDQLEEDDEVEIYTGDELEEMEIEIPDPSTQTDKEIISKQRNKLVLEAIQSLPEKYRLVIEMRHMEEKSYQEIAEILDLPLGTVKAHIFRARELLFKFLKDKQNML
jgi:RNA polymerase sigma-70 factor (ECF subfamily)